MLDGCHRQPRGEGMALRHGNRRNLSVLFGMIDGDRRVVDAGSDRDRSRHHNELLFGAGQRHIQYAHFLAEILGARAPDDRPSYLGIVQHAVFLHLHADAEIVVGDDLSPFAVLLEERAESRHDTDREFQPLGFVDGHDAHHVRILRHRDSAGKVFALLEHSVYRGDERAHAEGAGAFAPGGKFTEQADIRRADVAVRHGARRREIAGGVADLLHQPVGGLCGGKQPIMIHASKERGAFFVAVLRHRHDRAVQRRGTFFQPYPRHFVG